MSEYGSGVSFKQTCEYDRERIQKALKGELVYGENEDGFLYIGASKDDCKRYILEAYDQACYMASEAMHSGRALEKIAKDHGYDGDLLEYMAALKETAIEGE